MWRSLLARTTPGNTGPTTLAAIEDNLVSMAELARFNAIRVVLASVLPVSDYEMRDGKPVVQTVRRPPEQIKALNDWLKRYAAENKLIYLDYYSATVDNKGFLKDELSDDGLHPNAKGYAVMGSAGRRGNNQGLDEKIDSDADVFCVRLAEKFVCGVLK